MADRDRYVLLGLARARAAWFNALGRWATAAVIPAEFVRAVSSSELRARLASGRPFSAVIVDAGVGADRDLVATARDAGCPVLVVDDGNAGVDWGAIGVAGVLPPTFDREQLLAALDAHATMVGSTATVVDGASDEPVPLEGRVIAVCGPGGTGASATAIALAQGLAADAGDPDRAAGSVLLADLCRRADQAMLHDSRVVVPSVQELVEAHRSGTPQRSSVHDQTFEVATRGYRLLLGLRRPRHWVTLRRRAFEATLDSLQRTFDLVVCDIDPDVEGEAETGSVDVEERHLLTRAVLTRAEVAVVVGSPEMKGLYSLVRVITDLIAFGVPEQRVLPVIAQAPRNPRQRAELTSSLTSLLGVAGSSSEPTSIAPRARGDSARITSPVFLPTRRVDELLRDGSALPKALASTLASAYRAVRERERPASSAGASPQSEPTPIAPGSLGSFSSQQASGS